MKHVVAYDAGLDKFNPLSNVVCYDDFDQGLCGWLDLKPNFRYEDFSYHPGPVDLTHWGPTQLSTATFAFPGTHGSMNGTYSLKVCSRNNAGPYEERPAPGSQGCTIKRLTTFRPKGLLQMEAWLAYTPEQDRVGLSEQDIRAFGIMFDLQDEKHRFMPAVRYLNSVNGEPAQRWQYSHAADVSPEVWEHGLKEGWHRTGIDPQWYGRRYPDGRSDSFQDVPDGQQRLCYNETVGKINWTYVRFLFDLAKREYVELQAGQQVFDMRGLGPTLADRYANIDGLLNPVFWIEADADRRVFLYLDSIVISVD